MSEIRNDFAGNALTPRIKQTMTELPFQLEGAVMNLPGMVAGEIGKNDDIPKEQSLVKEKERKKLEEMANALFETLDLGLALKFHEKSGQWYAIVQNKITHEVVKEVPPKYMLDLQVQLKEMIGFFLDKRV